jgi:ketosteroid isomerase-like protein
MKNRIAMCMLGVIALGVIAVGPAVAADESAEKAVAAAEEQWTQSEKTNNAALAAPLLADRLIYIDTDGSISNRAKFLADSKGTKYVSVDAEDFHITAFGNTAVATMVFKAKGTDAKGKPLNIHARWADTWVKMPDGKWQCILSQGSDLKQ